MGRGRQALNILAIGLPLSSAAIASYSQDQLNQVLGSARSENIQGMRASCALGSAPKLRQTLVNAGKEQAPVSAWCVTVLTRAGRDKSLGYVRDPKSEVITPALAFDNGFVTAYLRKEPLPAGTPAMAALLPIAERCLRQQEPNDKLCTAAGHMLGLRAARGEVVVLP